MARCPELSLPVKLCASAQLPGDEILYAYCEGEIQERPKSVKAKGWKAQIFALASPAFYR
jgi:hypothetical protein